MDICATVTKVDAKVESCTQQDVELQCHEVWVTSISEPQLPLQIEDAARSKAESDKEGLTITVNQDTLLDNRVLDLRTPTNQAIYRLQVWYNFDILGLR